MLPAPSGARMRHPSAKRLSRLAILIYAVLLPACADSVSGPGAQARDVSAIQMSANVSGTSISTLVVTVTAPDITSPLVFNLEVASGTATGTLKVPAGSARLFEVKAYDTGGAITHEGSKTVNVARGSNPPLSIPLAPRPGEVPVTITMGNYSVVVNPATADLVMGRTLQLGATVTGPSVDPTQVRWSTANPSIARVDVTGLVTPLVAGLVTIHATYEGVTSWSQINVLARAPVGSITLTPTSVTLLRGGTQAFTATVRDDLGNVLADRPITWTSSNTAVATVNASGVATATGEGDATIAATSEGVSGGALVRVRGPYTVTLSGGTSPSTLIAIDDDLTVYHNGATIYRDVDGVAGPQRTMNFTVRPGDRIRVVATNAALGCAHLSPLYLHRSDGPIQVLDATGFPHRCSPAVAAGVFYDREFFVAF